MPSILIEMGFVSNPAEAARLNAMTTRTNYLWEYLMVLSDILTNR